MLSWNLPALIRNAVIFVLLCIYLNWNFLAWIFVVFVVFVEMDEELTKYETYSDYYKAQLELYDFSKATTADGWNLEEQLRIFNQQNPQVVQQYQKTFKNRLQEIRLKRNKSTKPQTKAKRAAHNKEEIRLKAETFGYTENHWDEQDNLISNAYVEVINHIGSTTMYEWYHLNGLTIAEEEYGIKSICLYQDKYIEANENKKYNQIMQSTIQQAYQHSITTNDKQSKPWPQLSHRTEKKEKINNLLYWPMSGYQKAQHRIPYISTHTPSKYVNKRINSIQHIKDISYMPMKDNQSIKNMYLVKLQAGINKQCQMESFETQTEDAHFHFKQAYFRVNRKKYKSKSSTTHKSKV